MLTSYLFLKVIIFYIFNLLGVLEVLLKTLLKRYGSTCPVNVCMLLSRIQCLDQPIQNASTNL